MSESSSPMQVSGRRHHLLLALSLPAILTFALTWMYALDYLEVPIMDLWLKHAPRASPNDEIGVIYIQGDALDRLKKTRLEMRAEYAELLRKLKQAGAETVVFDLSFEGEEDSDDEAAPTRELARTIKALKGAPNVVVAFDPESDVSELIRSAVGDRGWGSPEGGEELGRARKVLAARAGPEGAQPVLGLAARAVAAHCDVHAEDVRLWRSRLDLGGFRIPVDGDGYDRYMYINYSRRDAFQEYDYDEVKDKAAVPREKLVLIGGKDEMGMDTRRTVIGPLPGVAVHAHAISTILQKAYITPGSLGAWKWVNLVCPLLLCLGGSVLGLRVRRLLAWTIVGVAAAVLPIAAFKLFAAFRCQLWITYPLAGAIMGMVSARAARPGAAQTASSNVRETLRSQAEVHRRHLSQDDGAENSVASRAAKALAVVGRCRGDATGERVRWIGMTLLFAIFGVACIAMAIRSTSAAAQAIAVVLGGGSVVTSLTWPASRLLALEAVQRPYLRGLRRVEAKIDRARDDAELDEAHDELDRLLAIDPGGPPDAGVGNRKGADNK